MLTFIKVNRSLSEPFLLPVAYISRLAEEKLCFFVLKLVSTQQGLIRLFGTVLKIRNWQSVFKHCVKAGLITLGVVATDDEGKVLGYQAFSPIQVNGEDVNWVVISAAVIDPQYSSTSLAKDLLFEGLDSLNEFSYRAVVGYQALRWLEDQGFQPASGLSLESLSEQVVVIYPLEEQDAALHQAVLTLPNVDLTELTNH